LVDHIDYAVGLIGVEHAGISSDFGGGGGIAEWNNADETINVTLELVRRGYSEDEITMIWSGNVLRILKEAEAMAETLNTASGLKPSFENYIVVTSNEVLRSIDFSSHPDAENFRTRLEYSLNERPNFAGHYIVSNWGCGTMCQMVAIVDVKNGDVFFPFTTSMGVCFQADSSLIITNPLDEMTIEDFGEDMPDWLTSGYYTWDGMQMHLLDESSQAVDVSCDIF
jgi:hypothetical protein